MAEQSYLYKYRHFDRNNPDHAQRIFTENEVYFPNPNQFNDPFDCRHGFSFTASTKDIRDYFGRSLKRNHPNMPRGERRRWIKERVTNAKLKSQEFHDSLTANEDTFLSSIGIFSLTKVPDNILMWSHYADSHRGFCLKFKDDPDEWFIGRAQEVIYAKEFPIVNPITDSETDRFDKEILTKAKDWEYEEEWRVVDPFDGPGIKRFPPEILQGVIFGCKMSEASKDLIYEWCKNRKSKLKFYQAIQKTKTYGLKIVPA
ncbi:MAG: DUF2971 domain-containing protein [Alphaproteobacteria bacterium]|uniref:DUF2971 domain-containing protein n=1 Tax=Nisaea sp. TaxID=2024842 RepID=UPI003264B2AD